MAKSNSNVLQKLGRPGGLAEQLLRLRKAAGLTGSELATRNGWGHSKVSKIENANQEPSPQDLDAWVDACGGTADDRDILHTLLDNAKREVQEHERALRGGQDEVQARVDADFRTARHIFNFETFIVPGLLQTTEYARYRLQENVDMYGADPEGVEPGLAVRMRRQEILYDSTKQFEFVVTQAALHTLFCPPAVMRGQLDRLLGLSGMQNVRFGVVPVGGVRLKRVLVNGFVVLDDKVFAETYANEEKWQGGREFELYSRFAKDLLSQVVEGDDVTALILAAQEALPS